MKILFVLENYIPHIGGVEVVFRNLSEDLAKKGYDVSILTHRLKGTNNFEIINGVKVHRVNCFHSRYWFTFLSIPKAIKLAKEADIIHTTMYNGAFPAKIASILLKKPNIITIPEILGKNWEIFEMSRISKKLHRFLEKQILKLNFNKYVSISKSTQSCVLKENIPKAKSKVIYCGVDYEFFNPKLYNGKRIRKKLNLKNNFVYMFYGRPGISKGLEYLIKAIPLISKNIKNSKLLAIVSKDKAYEKRYNQILELIKKLNIQDKIILLDPVKRKELPNYIKAADCIVVPSLTEGFGLCAAEACAMEIPVVASNTTSLPEVVSGKYVLVEPKDPKAIAKGIELVSKNKIKKKDKKIFKWDNATKKYLNLYKTLK